MLFRSASSRTNQAISASLSAGTRASDRSTAVGANALDALSTTTGLCAPSGLGLTLPATTDAYVRAAGAPAAWLPPAPPPPALPPSLLPNLLAPLVIVLGAALAILVRALPSPQTVAPNHHDQPPLNTPRPRSQPTYSNH